MNKQVTIEFMHSYLTGSGAKFGKDRLSDAKRQIGNYNRIMRDEVRKSLGLVRGRDSQNRVIWE